MGAQPEGGTDDDALVSKRDVRKSLAHSLKLPAVSAGVDSERISNHSIRSGGNPSCLRLGLKWKS